MSRKLFTADLHFGHDNIIKFRPFATEEEHREVVIDNILSSATRRDTLWILGDICFKKESFQHLQRIVDNVGYVRIVPGNHDMEAAEFINRLQGNVRVYSFTEERHCWYSHCPIHPGQMRGRVLNVHGHLHHEVVRHEDGTPDDRYFCVSLEQNNYLPFTWDDIRERIREVKDESYSESLPHPTDNPH